MWSLNVSYNNLFIIRLIRRLNTRLLLIHLTYTVIIFPIIQLSNINLVLILNILWNLLVTLLVSLVNRHIILIMIILIIVLLDT